MTKRERVLVVAVLVSVFGFSFLGTFNPVNAGLEKGSVVTEFTRTRRHMRGEVGEDIDTRCFKNHQDSERHSRMVNMLSTVLHLTVEEVEDLLSNGSTPRSLLAGEGILLSDLQEEFNFDLVGRRGFVRFK